MKYDSNTCSVNMSVRSLCALALRHGDLDFSSRPSRESMLAGADIHRRLQREAGGIYSPEASLSCTTLYGGIYYHVSGRADGIIKIKDSPVIDEIKCVRASEFFQPPQEAHLGQLKCYAHFFCAREGAVSVRARLTYYNTESKRLRYFHYTFDAEYLRRFYTGLLERVHFYAHLEAKRTAEVLPAAANALFPYKELRDGQQLMIRECFGAIKRGERLFLEAPTGTGKTISSLYPSIRAMGNGLCDKIFYLTAKASVRREAYAAASKIFSSGVGIRAVVLSAKEQMCALEGGCKRGRCDAGCCVRARGYYDRLDGALCELLSGANGYPSALIRKIADKHMLCPYELSLDLSEYCDIIICDYNYAFAPLVELRRYFADGGRGERYTFLIDEVHNLTERARDMYSAVLSLSDFVRVSALFEGKENPLSGIESSFMPLRALCRDSIHKTPEGGERGFALCREPLFNFNNDLELVRKRCDTYLYKNPDCEQYDELYALSSAVRQYLCVGEYFDKGFLNYIELDGTELTVKVYCLDPSRVMNKLLCRAVSAIMFSATLAPPDYFCNVLGCGKNTYTVTLPSPFDAQNLCVAAVDSVSTRFEDREANTQKFVSLIAASVSARAGNYIAYFPSYDCLERVYRAFSKRYPRVQTVLQKKGMRQSEKEEFLGAFKNDTGRLRIGFCVLGGAFSEGVDLPGSRLIGAIIFGVGLPGLSNERNIIKEYFDDDGGVGYDYAYTYPGMNNVLQAAGRVIRTESDRGVVVLVDDRYASHTYRRLFPTHWRGVQYAGNARSLAELLRRFWENGE